MLVYEAASVLRELGFRVEGFRVDRGICVDAIGASLAPVLAIYGDGSYGRVRVSLLDDSGDVKQSFEVPKLDGKAILIPLEHVSSDKIGPLTVVGEGSTLCLDQGPAVIVSLVVRRADTGKR